MIKHSIAAVLVATLVGCKPETTVSTEEDKTTNYADTLHYLTTGPSKDEELDTAAPQTDTDTTDAAEAESETAATDESLETPDTEESDPTETAELETVDECLSATLGNPFNAVSGDQSDPIFTPISTIDETLDAGALEYIQGVYLWSGHDRAQWFSIEQSADGETWDRTWRVTKSQAGADSTYFSLDTDSPIRYVRITGYGSANNAWTTLSEVRWSLSGEEITTAQAWRHSDDLVAFNDGEERAVTAMYKQAMGRMFYSCPYAGKPVFADASGTLDSFWTFQEVGDVMVYSLDWSHYSRPAEPDFFGAPLETYEPMRHAQAMLEPLAAEDELLLMPTDCGVTVVSDSLHIIDEMLTQVDQGQLIATDWH